MKTLKPILFALIGIFFYSVNSAQVRIISGSVEGLKGVKNVNIIYDYSNLSVGDFETEQGYLDKREANYKNEPGKFEKFKSSWTGSRKTRYEPKFELMFNKTGEKSGIAGTNYADNGDVTLMVETEFIEPGFHVGVVKRAAKINIKCTFYDNKNQPIVVYVVKNVRGATPIGYDFDSGTRISEAYAKAAKILMSDLNKRLRKIK
jgi:hypothetical protein